MPGRVAAGSIFRFVRQVKTRPTLDWGCPFLLDLYFYAHFAPGNPARVAGGGSEFGVLR